MNIAECKTKLTTLRKEMEDLTAQISTLAEPEPAEPAYPAMIKIPDRSYSVSETPVTVKQYQYFCVSTDREMPKQPDPQHSDNPVVNVSWHDAQDYIAWLSDTQSAVYRLPVEDEFEHFCGDHKEAREDIAVYAQAHIQPVKTKEPNNYGLYDCTGLVWEWQENSYE